MLHPATRFYGNLFGRFCTSLLTYRQTNKNIASLMEENILLEEKLFQNMHNGFLCLKFFAKHETGRVRQRVSKREIKGVWKSHIWKYSDFSITRGDVGSAVLFSSHFPFQSLKKQKAAFCWMCFTCHLCGAGTCVAYCWKERPLPS